MDFMNMTWTSDANMLFKEDNSKDYIILDSYIEYFSDLGSDRVANKVRDYNTFVKVYIRSSPKMRVIKRVYTKLTEYLAQMSSILSTFLLILYVIVTYLNLFKARQSIMKKIMKFKENMSHKKNDSILYLRDKFSNAGK